MGETSVQLWLPQNNQASKGECSLVMGLVTVKTPGENVPVSSGRGLPGGSGTRSMGTERALIR